MSFLLPNRYAKSTAWAPFTSGFRYVTPQNNPAWRGQTFACRGVVTRDSRYRAKLIPLHVAISVHVGGRAGWKILPSINFLGALGVARRLAFGLLTVIMRRLAPTGRLAPIGEIAPGCDKKHNVETFNRVFASPSERSHPGAISPT